MESQKLKCPCCKSVLQQGENKRLQSLIEHVLFPNDIPSHKQTFICTNPYCLRSEDDTMWTSDGLRYGGPFTNDIFINKNDAPFGSLQRRLNVEIYKRGVPERKKLFSIGRYHFYKTYSYRANNQGEVLSSSSKIELWIDDGSLQTKWINPFIMIIHSIKDYFKDPDNKALYVYYFNDWWRKVTRFILKYPLFQYKRFKSYEDNTISK